MTEQNQPTPKDPPKQSQARPAPAPSPAAPDHIRRLIAALDQPEDALHAQAVDELIVLGPQAVPALTAALETQGPWLRAFRAAEALGQIGDGRASRPLVAALRHPHSNVRWSVVQALAKVGDSRAILALRRVVRQDRGKTSWGEPVAAAAQAALADMQRRSAVWRLSDPVRIALLAAAAIFALWLATGRVQAFRTAVDEPGNTAAWGTAVVPIIPTPAPEDEEVPEEEFADLTPSPTAPDPAAITPTVVAVKVTATVNQPTANVRPAPNTNNEPIAKVAAGDVVEVLAQSGEWYRVRLADGTEGWVAGSVVSAPSGPVPTAVP
jgi:hypothetical protein